MKGFKSFADTTILEFEPGVTAVVGPNGSGKSNVVDAVTWVLGAQSTRALRSTRMDDVVFMGTANRAALGRAEVSLTLDNSSGRLPIDGAEVTISRTLFRNGDSEYAINGTTCRLLDVQELLGDSGVGRQQHMIIGQGQLDSILSSNPENRRAVIEEAAGVLKHRRRKERSERRLAATQENLERLGDLVREVRRQMRPLERQAASARSYADVEGELRDARHVLFAARLHNFEQRRRELEHVLDESSIRERDLRHEIVALDAKSSAAAAEMASRREEVLASNLGRLQGLAERARGTSSVIHERERSLRQALIASADENVIATLEADAARIGSDLAALGETERTLAPLREALVASRRRLLDAEARLETTEPGIAFGEDARTEISHAEGSLADLRERARKARQQVDVLLEGLALEGDDLVRHAPSLRVLAGELAEELLDVDAGATELRAVLPRLGAALADAAERDLRRRELEAELAGLRGQVGEDSTALDRHEAEVAERRRLLESRLGEVESRLAGRSGEREVAAVRREALEFDRRALTRLAALVERAAEEIRVAQGALDSSYREQLEATRASAEMIEEVRAARHDADARLSALGDGMRRHEIEQAELAVKISNLHEIIRRDLGVDPYEMGAPPYVDLPEGATLEGRVAELEARITSLGPINPLALEELAALEARYKELDAQVSDVRHARRELQEVLRALDEQIMQTFTAAFADVNEHFSSLIATLFPGGQGRLSMSEPDDPLNTGVEIEVRPMGRNVRRISLLSGGERSMAALAFLFAVFRSRPSPFYLMDEVEAALDDVNLQRFLSLVDEFRDEAQLLIVTHQKRTMEAADVLYGVTMVPGASSKVVSQRVTRAKEEQSA